MLRPAVLFRGVVVLVSAVLLGVGAGAAHGQAAGGPGVSAVANTAEPVPPGSEAGETPPAAAPAEARPPAPAEQRTAPPAEQRTAPPAEQQTAAPAATQPASAPARSTSKAWGARLDPEPPAHVKTADKLGLPGWEEVDWLEFGLVQRTRFELRDDDYRRPRLDNDEQFLLRSQVYLGVKEIIDPLRFGLEFSDMRQFAGNYPETNGDVNEADFLQAFGELYFKDALGKGYPVAFRAGRMTFDSVARLVNRGRWRNTQSSFDGFRLRAGTPGSDWQVDFLAAQPVERRMRRPDVPDEERWLYGLVGAWRGWEKYVTIEPHYLIHDEDRTDPALADRTIHTLGMHLFGPIAGTKFDYDTDLAFQFGDDGERRHCAFAGYGEIGYTFTHAWKPRLSLGTVYASGDRDPNDTDSERFDRLYASSHSYSTWDYFSWQNQINPKIRIEFKPTSKLRVDASYGVYWLASDSDAWVVPNRRDRTGASGDFIGQELELHLRYQLDPRAEIELGYSHFMPGPFGENTGEADDSDLFYVQTTLQL